MLIALSIPAGTAAPEPWISSLNSKLDPDNG